MVLEVHGMVGNSHSALLSISNRADGYYDDEGVWHLERARDLEQGANPFDIVDRIDSRGIPLISTGFVFGVGKTFKSGKLNIPLNAFFIPGNNGNHRIGLSFGFNSPKKKSMNRARLDG